MSERFLTLFRLFTKDPWTQYTYGPAIILGLLSLLGILLYLPREVFMPLHYNVYFGIDYLGSWYQAFLVPLVGLALVIINASVGFFLWRRDKLPSYFLGVGTLAVAVIIATTTGLTIYLNI